MVKIPRCTKPLLLAIAIASAMATTLSVSASRADAPPLPRAEAEAEATPKDGVAAPKESAATPLPPLQPHVHHAPPTVVRADQSLTIGASIDRPDRMKEAVVVYRHGDALKVARFERSSQGSHPYVAIIPAEDVSPPMLAYTIEIERTDGVRVADFATRAEMHDVVVAEEVADLRERAALARLEGRRSVVATSGEFVYFGDTQATVGDASAPVTRSFRDQYYRIEGSYTYRFLHTIAEFGIRAGVVRGQAVVPNERDPSKFDVGLNYGAPRLRLRAEDWLHFEMEGLTSVTEIGFAVGGGAAVLIGDPYGGKLTLGLEGVEVFGVRGYSRLDLVLTRRLTVAPIIEVTSMPHASSAGVRLLGDVVLDLGNGFGVALRGGYQARTFASGGPAAGASMSYAF
jgi:hypothetical protein